MLRGEGWRVNHKRVQRIWRQEGLKVPRKQPKHARLALGIVDQSSIATRRGRRLRPGSAHPARNTASLGIETIRGRLGV
jgi:transposase InsO family protein